MPKRITERTPALRADSDSRRISSTESWNTPGMELTGLRTFFPGRAKSGRTKRASRREVSATKSRSAGVARRRRKRWTGKVPVGSCMRRTVRESEEKWSGKDLRRSAPGKAEEQIRVLPYRIPTGVCQVRSSRFGGTPKSPIWRQADLRVGGVARTERGDRPHNEKIGCKRSRSKEPRR